MIVVIGYGNTLRSDDGVGVSIATTLQKKNIPGVRIHITQQLTPEFLEEFQPQDKIILIDARQDGPPIQIRKVVSGKEAHVSSSHHLAPELFSLLADSIYQKELALHVCSIRGESFELGEKLTEPVKKRAQEVLQWIESFIGHEVSHA